MADDAAIYETARILDNYAEELLGNCRHNLHSLTSIIEEVTDDSPIITEIQRLILDVSNIQNHQSEWNQLTCRHLYEYIIPLKNFATLLQSWSHVDNDKVSTQYQKMTIKYINRIRAEVTNQEPLNI